MEKIVTLQQDNHDKLTVITTEEQIIFTVKKLYRYKKDVLSRFYKMGSADYDRVIYFIYQQVKWNYKF